MNTALQLTGIGLRTPHHAAFLEKRPSIAWVEVHSENYFGEGGKSLHTLETVRSHYPVSLHGVGLSLGSADELNWQHLKKLRDLINRIDPCLVSEHLSWSSINGQYFHDLLPLPHTKDIIDHLITRIQQTQDYLNRSILIENITRYVNTHQDDLSEPEFITAVAQQSGCGILLDINNIYINSINFNFDPYEYLTAIPASLIQEIHLGGFTTTKIDEKEILLDTHNRPIVPAVWDLYRHAIQSLGKKPTMIEWDADLPTVDTLCLEAYRAEKIIRETYVPASMAN